MNRFAKMNLGGFMVFFNDLNEIILDCPQGKESIKYLVSNKTLNNVMFKGRENVSIEIKNCNIVGSIVLNRFDTISMSRNNYFESENKNCINIGDDVTEITLQNESINGMGTILLSASKTFILSSIIDADNVILKGDTLLLDRSFIASPNIVNSTKKLIGNENDLISVKVKTKGVRTWKNKK